MAFDPKIHNRQSIRLKGYDYAQAGAYFITICVQDKAHLFGRVVKGEMHLNAAGEMVQKWWQQVPEKFPDTQLDAFIIMLNHFHAIVINVGADPCVCPMTAIKTNPDQMTAIKTDPDHISAEIMLPDNKIISGHVDRGHQDRGHQGGHMGPPLRITGTLLSQVVQWFKTMVTNEYIRGVKTLGWPPFDGKLWQRNYYEHIIRNERAYLLIADYIQTNPNRWREDCFFSE